MTPEQHEAFVAKVLGVPNKKPRKTGRRFSHALASMYGATFVAACHAAGSSPRVWWHVALWACLAVALSIAEVYAICREDREL